MVKTTLPGIDKDGTNLHSESERLTVTILAYLVALYLLFLLGFAIHNIVKYLI